jgi:hypothetical protein
MYSIYGREYNSWIHELQFRWGIWAWSWQFLDLRFLYNINFTNFNFTNHFCSGGGGSKTLKTFVLITSKNSASGWEGGEGVYSMKIVVVVAASMYISIFTWKGYEECVGEKTANLATLKSKSIYLITFSKRLQWLKQEWQTSPSGTRQTEGKNSVWFGEIERKLAKLSKTTFTYRSSS